ncbi:unnamed protein product [Spirodela intermedia]|uniref:Uncharacterized protein n=1 Tax=Spirodela intermedia TaxID=51605 RepID=A0A7I8KLQ8_SPIIN|nr:unnamed protein product [Spirodela intermedia]
MESGNSLLFDSCKWERRERYVTRWFYLI